MSSVVGQLMPAERNSSEAARKKSVRSLDETVSTTVDRYAECAKTYAVSHFAEVGLPKIS